MEKIKRLEKVVLKNCELTVELEYYYDDEIVNVPSGKVVRQTGIYKYQTKSEDYKTVPIIEIVDK